MQGFSISRAATAGLTRRAFLTLTLGGLVSIAMVEAGPVRDDMPAALNALMQALIGIDDPSVDLAAGLEDTMGRAFKRHYYKALVAYVGDRYGHDGRLDLPALIADLSNRRLPGQATTIPFIAEQLKGDALRIFYSCPAGWAVAGYDGPQLRIDPAGARCPS